MDSPVQSSAATAASAAFPPTSAPLPRPAPRVPLPVGKIILDPPDKFALSHSHKRLYEEESPRPLKRFRSAPAEATSASESLPLPPPVVPILSIDPAATPQDHKRKENTQIVYPGSKGVLLAPKSFTKPTFLKNIQKGVPVWTRKTQFVVSALVSVVATRNWVIALLEIHAKHLPEALHAKPLLCIAMIKVRPDGTLVTRTRPVAETYWISGKEDTVVSTADWFITKVGSSPALVDPQTHKVYRVVTSIANEQTPVKFEPLPKEHQPRLATNEPIRQLLFLSQACFPNLTKKVCVALTMNSGQIVFSKELWELLTACKHPLVGLVRYWYERSLTVHSLALLYADDHPCLVIAVERGRVYWVWPVGSFALHKVDISLDVPAADRVSGAPVAVGKFLAFPRTATTSLVIDVQQWNQNWAEDQPKSSAVEEEEDEYEDPWVLEAGMRPPAPFTFNPAEGQDVLAKVFVLQHPSPTVDTLADVKTDACGIQFGPVHFSLSRQGHEILHAKPVVKDRAFKAFRRALNAYPSFLYPPTL
jgi:hypothetical protein